MLEEASHSSVGASGRRTGMGYFLFAQFRASWSCFHTTQMWRREFGVLQSSYHEHVSQIWFLSISWGCWVFVWKAEAWGKLCWRDLEESRTEGKRPELQNQRSPPKMRGPIPCYAGPCNGRPEPLTSCRSPPKPSNCKNNQGDEIAVGNPGNFLV